MERMESRKKQPSGATRRRKRSGIRVWMVLLIVFAAVLTIGGVLARYISSNRQRAEMESAQFHISSNYLQEGDGAAYTVADWGSGFDILLFNYEKENIAQISGVEMTYRVTAEHAQVRVTAQSGDEIPLNGDGEYTFPAELTNAQHTLHVTPSADAGANTRITVTVETTSPYQKTLRAEFQIQHNRRPDYTVTDRGDGTILITVKTNDYADSMKVTWDAAHFSPDNTNVLMASWKNDSPTGSFRVERNSTYELLFFTDKPYAGITGTGTEITLE